MDASCAKSRIRDGQGSPKRPWAIETVRAFRLRLSLAPKQQGQHNPREGTTDVPPVSVILAREPGLPDSWRTFQSPMATRAGRGLPCPPIHHHVHLSRRYGRPIDRIRAAAAASRNRTHRVSEERFILGRAVAMGPAPAAAPYSVT